MRVSARCARPSYEAYLKGADFLFQLETSEGATLLYVRGDIDQLAGDSFREVLELVQRTAARDVIVILNECAYLDSTGLNELVRARNALGGRLRVVVSQGGIVDRVFTIAGLNGFLNVTRSVADALRNLIA